MTDDVHCIILTLMRNDYKRKKYQRLNIYMVLSAESVWGWGRYKLPKSIQCILNIPEQVSMTEMLQTFELWEY